MKPKSCKGYTLIETGVSITIAALVMSLLLPSLASIQARMVRSKCKNNLKNVNLCYIVYAQDFAMKFPWVNEKRDQVRQGFSYYGAFDTRELYCNLIIRSMLGFPDILLSPCDVDKKVAMEEVGSHFRFKDFYPNNASSYTVCAGTPNPDLRTEQKDGLSAQEFSANYTHTQTILTTTRNIVGPINDGDSLSDQSRGNPIGNPDLTEYATWVGADDSDEKLRNTHSMANLKSGFGQVGLADGSAHQYDTGKLVTQIRKHHKDKGVEYRGIPSPIFSSPNDPIPGAHKDWVDYGSVIVSYWCSSTSRCRLPGDCPHVNPKKVSTWKLYETGKKEYGQGGAREQGFYRKQGKTYTGRMVPMDQPSYIWEEPAWLRERVAPNN